MNETFVVIMACILAYVQFFNKITAPPGLFILPSGVGVVECDELERERFKAYVEYETMDGEIKIPPDAESYLGTISPFFDPTSIASSAACQGRRFIRAPSDFIVRCIALVTSFVEYQQLPEDGPDDGLKREFQARVAAMVRALAACPFDQTHALNLGMTERLRDMEAALVSDGTVGGAVGAVDDGAVCCGPRVLTTEEANRLVGVTFPRNAGPSETRARAVVCAFFAVKRRVRDKFAPIALCPHHFEIRHEANVYDEESGDPVLVVRGRDSPHGSTIRSIEVIHGLSSSATIDLAEITRGERKKVAFKGTATVLGIMRIQKARLQTAAAAVVVPDPALALLVEFLEAVAIELASV